MRRTIQRIAAWIRNPAREFREQTLRQKRTNLEFLRENQGDWFRNLPEDEQDTRADYFMNLQRHRLWVWRTFLWAIFGLAALFFLKR